MNLSLVSANTLTAYKYPYTHLILEFVHLGYHYVDDAAQNDDEIESIPRVAEVVLYMITICTQVIRALCHKT